MGFKSVKSYNDARYGGMFLLKNDGDYADVIFMYQDIEDVLVADTHYIKSPDYSGYVHCCGKDVLHVLRTYECRLSCSFHFTTFRVMKFSTLTEQCVSNLSYIKMSFLDILIQANTCSE